MDQPQEFYVYVVFDLLGEPRYVGKGKGRRWGNHLWRSHNTYLRRMVAKAGGALPIALVREDITETEAFASERALIAAIGRLDLGTGPLLNLTDGGDGVAGFRRTPEQRAAMSEARKGKTTLTPAGAARISAALKGVAKSPAHVAAAAAGRKGKGSGRKLPKSHCEAIGRAHLGQKRSPEACAAIKAGQDAMSPERRALKGQRISAALTGKTLAAEHCAKISAVQKGKPKFGSGRITPGKQRIIPSYERSGIEPAYRNGESVRSISIRLNVPFGVIERHLKAAGVVLRNRAEAAALANYRRPLEEQRAGAAYARAVKAGAARRSYG